MPPTPPSPRRDPHRALGAGLGIDDFDAVATLGGVCDRLGIDVISAGNTVAWAVRASDAGLIDPADHGVDRGSLRRRRGREGADRGDRGSVDPSATRSRTGWPPRRSGSAGPTSCRP